MLAALVVTYLHRPPRQPPGQTCEYAFQIAMRWIHDDIPLNESLRRMGYHTSQKYLTEAHFEVLKEYLGEPLE